MPTLPRQAKPHNAAAIRKAWAGELTAARKARANGDAAGQWRHLERAHILSQPFALPHIRTHVAMLRFGIHHRNRREILGQLVRLVVAGPGSAMRRYPLGDTGGANVSAVQPMDIPSDLQATLTGVA